jgi:ABC-2 type transport system permease protein
MSTISAPPRPASDSRITTVGLLRSEWIKLRSVRSTVWLFAIIVLASLGMSLLLSSTISPDLMGVIPPSEYTNIVVQASTFGIFFGQLVVAVLGVLVISGEYTTGMIRSTLTAVPKRIPALLAKAVVLFVTTFVVGAVATFGAYLIAVPVLAGKGIEATDPVFGELLLGVLYLALTAVFALGIGTIVRSSAGGIAAALGVVLLLPTVLQIIVGVTQAEWAADLAPYLFSNAGSGMYTMDSTPGAFEVWQNVLIVVVWTLVSLIGGLLLLKRRDA